jgi:hypothetical protein
MNVVPLARLSHTIHRQDVDGILSHRLSDGVSRISNVNASSLMMAQARNLSRSLEDCDFNIITKVGCGLMAHTF